MIKEHLCEDVIKTWEQHTENWKVYTDEDGAKYCFMNDCPCEVCSWQEILQNCNGTIAVPDPKVIFTEHC